MVPPPADKEDLSLCPVCLDHLPFDPNETEQLYCCGHAICSGCSDRRVRAIDKARDDGSAWRDVSQLATRCPMCRTRLPGSDHEILRMIEKASEEGKAWARFELANVYLFGRLGVERDDAGGMELLTSAAEQGFARAQHHLGEIFDRGNHGVARSPAEAMRWYEAAAENGNAASRFNLACTYRQDEGNISEYLRHCKMAADAGLPAARYNIGNAYLQGQFGLERSIEKAIEYYTPSAKAGHVKAQNMLGMAIVSKTPFAVNNPEYPEAMRWIRLAAAGGNEEAKENIMNLEGHYSHICFACLKTDRSAPPLNRCTRCRSAWYCSKTCQKTHWKKLHKSFCCRHDEQIVAGKKEKENVRIGKPRSAAEATEAVLPIRTCSACMRPKAEDAYSEENFKLPARVRRCRDCIEAGRESKAGFTIDHIDTSNPDDPIVTVSHNVFVPNVSVQDIMNAAQNAAQTGNSDEINAMLSGAFKS